MKGNVYIYIICAAAVSTIIRVMPLVLIKGQIKNRFLRSFLYYVPYVTLAVMTFPAIVEATPHQAAGICALIAGIVLSWFGAGLCPVAAVCCSVVFVLELLLR